MEGENMSKQNSAGVYQKTNGYWEYRFVLRINGKRVARKKCTDEHGNRFKTKREAIAAREAAMVALRTEKTSKPKSARRTVKEPFELHSDIISPSQKQEWTFYGIILITYNGMPQADHRLRHYL